MPRSLTARSTGHDPVRQHHRFCREDYFHARRVLHSVVTDLLLLSTSKRQRHQVVQLGSTRESSVDIRRVHNIHRTNNLALLVR